MIKALFFDQDWVIIDTERDGHRVAFNQAFSEFGFPIEWSVEKYHELLQVGGGKERMRHFLDTEGFGKAVPPEEKDDLIRRLHKRKTDIFINLLEKGSLPLRPGVHRLMREAQDAGLQLGICTTSNQRAADAITTNLLGDIHFNFVLAGDVVKMKKPDPEIYLMALDQSGLKPEACAVIEDSNIGSRAARESGCHVIATVNEYTAEEDLSMADLVLSDLGESYAPAELLYPAYAKPTFPGFLNLKFLESFLS